MLFSICFLLRLLPHKTFHKHYLLITFQEKPGCFDDLRCRLSPRCECALAFFPIPPLEAFLSKPVPPNLLFPPFFLPPFSSVTERLGALFQNHPGLFFLLIFLRDCSPCKSFYPVNQPVILPFIQFLLFSSRCSPSS